VQDKNSILFYGELVARAGLACQRKLFPRKDRDLRWKHPFSIVSYQARQQLALRHFNPRQFEMPREGERFVYFPLHLDPEASTMILAPEFVDQSLTIDLLAKSIPLSHKLYVKEHPAMIGRRPSGFYCRIRENVNVRLINPLAESMELSRSADLVTVITGTAGWEAVLMGRLVLTLGESFFSHLGFSYHCSDVHALGPLIKDLVLGRCEVRKGREDLTRWMYCLYQGSFHIPDGIAVIWPAKPITKASEKTIHAAGILADQLKAVLRKGLTHARV
jgi:hypothetical protein